MISSDCSLRWQTFFVATMSAKMEAKYLEILYVTELMMLIGLSGVPCFWILGSQ